MNVRRGFAAAVMLVAGSVLGLGPAALAKDGSAVHEAVVNTIASDGSVVSTRISQLIQLESQSGEEVSLRVPRASELTSYRNLTGFANPSGEGDDFVWRTSDKLDASALAKTTQDLPVRVRITYSIDGRQVEPEDVKGEDGNVKIEVEVTNVSGDPKTLRYEGVTSPFLTSTVNQYVPIEYLVRAEFPTDRWSRVGGPDVHVTPSGTELVVASGSGFIFPPATDPSATVEFQATSDDVLLPRIQVYANAHASQEYLDALQAQIDALKALYGGFGSLGDTLTQIYDGTVELADGVDDLLGGVGARDEKTKEPVVTLDKDGLPTTVIGTLGFLEQTIRGDVLGGIGERDKATGEGVVVKDDKGHTTTLIGGLQSQKDTYDDDLIPAAQDALAGIDDFISQVSGGGDQLTAGLEQLQDGVGLLISSLDTDFKDGLQELLTGLGDKNDLKFADIITGVPCVFGTSPTCLPADVLTALTVMNAGVDEMLTGLGDKDAPTFVDPGTGAPCFPPDGVTCIPGDALSALIFFESGLGDIGDGLTALIAGLDGPGGFRENLATAQGIASTAGPTCSGAALEADCLTAFGTINAILTGLLSSLGTSGNPPPTIVGTLEALSAGVSGIEGGIGSLIDSLQTNDPLNPGLREGLEQTGGGLTSLLDQLQTDDLLSPGFREGLVLLLAGLGDAADAPTEDTVIGALGLIFGGLDQAAPGSGALVDAVIGGLLQIRAGFTNPEFTQSQPALDGRTPKEYFQDCPACFDPTSPKFDPATDHADFQPALLEVFTLFSEGIRDALPSLQSFDPDNPGLVDGLQQIADGLETLASKLHTLDPDDPGVVEGLALVRGGLQQVSQGLFATNELGVRTSRGQIGDQGDSIAQWRKALEDASAETSSTGALGQQANDVKTTYVFDLAAQSTGTRDNTVRGALMALTGAGLVVLWRRPRPIG